MTDVYTREGEGGNEILKANVVVGEEDEAMPNMTRFSEKPQRMPECQSRALM
jgi:hypothetical protein